MRRRSWQDGDGLSCAVHAQVAYEHAEASYLLACDGRQRARARLLLLLARVRAGYAAAADRELARRAVSL